MLQRLSSKLIKHKDETLYDYLESIKDDSFVTPEMFGDTNGDATNAIRSAIDTGKDVLFKKGKEYKVSSNIYLKTNYQKLHGNNCIINWVGGDSNYKNNNRNYGIFQPVGSRIGDKRGILGGIPYGSHIINVDTTGLPDTGYIIVEKTGDGLNVTLNPYMRYIVKYKILDSNRLYMYYRSSWNYTGDITIQEVEPIVGVDISDFHLKDTQVVTITGSITVQSPQQEREKAISLIHASYAVDCKFTKLSATNFKFPIIQCYIISNIAIDNITGIKPDWVAGGEGYLLQLSNALYCDTSNMFGTSTRHIVDVTTGAYCNFYKLIETNPIGSTSVLTHGSYESNLVFEKVHVNRLGFAGAGAAYGYATHSIIIKDSVINETIYNYTLSIKFEDCTINSFYLQTNNLVVNNCYIKKLVRLNKMSIHSDYSWSDSILGNYVIINNTKIGIVDGVVIDSYDKVHLDNDCYISTDNPIAIEFRNCNKVYTSSDFVNIYMYYTGDINILSANHRQIFTKGNGIGLRTNNIQSNLLNINLNDLSIDAGGTEVVPISIGRTSETSLSLSLCMNNVEITNSTKLSRIVNTDVSFEFKSTSIGSNFLDTYIAGSYGLYINIPDKVKWKVGKVLPNGEAGAPRMWNGNNWITL